MTKEQMMVRDFHMATKQVVNDIPTAPTQKLLYFRGALIKEENEEFLSATTMEDFADALGDLLYVVYGAAVSLGIDLEPVFDEIHKSNMTKISGGYKREDGKWMKGKGFVPPNLKPIIDEQCSEENLR